MDSIVQEKVKHFLREKCRRDWYECGAIAFQIRKLAQMSGYDLDRRFAHAGLASGPEARIASAIVAQSIGTGGGSATTMLELTRTMDRWVRILPPMGY